MILRSRLRTNSFQSLSSRPTRQTQTFSAIRRLRSLFHHVRPQQCSHAASNFTRILVDLLNETSCHLKAILVTSVPQSAHTTAPHANSTAYAKPSSATTLLNQPFNALSNFEVQKQLLPPSSHVFRATSRCRVLTSIHQSNHKLSCRYARPNKTRILPTQHYHSLCSLLGIPSLSTNNFLHQ